MFITASNDTRERSEELHFFHSGYIQPERSEELLVLAIEPERSQNLPLLVKISVLQPERSEELPLLVKISVLQPERSEELPLLVKISASHTNKPP